ncbi:hypothetical protein [Pontibacter arcticus]|nr:hypothetical protein [Pontibacter arcticus]
MIMNHSIDADIPIFGSSVALEHFNPALLTKATGHSAYNFGFEGTKLNQYGGLLEEFNTYSNAEFVVIAGTVNEFSESNFATYKSNYIPFLKNGKIYTFLSNLEPRTFFLLRYVPFYSFTFFNNNYYKEIFDSNNVKGDPLKGFYPENNVWEAGDSKSAIKYKIDLESIERFRRVVQKINLKERKVILILAPIYIEGQKQITNLNQIREIYKSLAGAENIFMDFTESNICNRKELFYNNTHLNIAGADLFSKEFSEKFSAL